MSFRIEIADISRMILRNNLTSTSSVSSEESEDESAPFTTSPLDQCRGATQPTPAVKYRRRKVRDAPHTQTHKAVGQKR